MSKLFIQNLGLIITEKCNLKCSHCMRGTCTSKDMSNEVIDEIFEQVDSIGNLTICGGEPTLAIPTLERIFSSIIANNTLLDCTTVTINGTNYSQELIWLLDEIDKYMQPSKFDTNAWMGISRDPFHMQEIIRLGLRKQYIENLKKYSENKHFLQYREITKKLFREGRATQLPEELTVPLRPWPIITSYTTEKSTKEKICAIGPLVSINVDGIVTDCDASIEHQHTIYNYGNILEESLEDICIREGEIVPARKWYRQTGKIMKKQATYNK